MALLLLGMILFFAAHSVSIASPHWRDSMVTRVGEMPWKAAYGLVSLAGLVMMVYGYGLARMDPVFLYHPPMFLRHITSLLMLPVFPLLLAAYLPGRIQRWSRHPMLVAVKLWALAHLLANGTLADLLLFGGFLAWAVADRISLRHRAPRPVPGAPATPVNDFIVVLGGLALYVVFALWLHPRLIGVPVMG